MRLTREILEQGKSKRGGWSYAQINALGQDPTRKGWTKRVLRTEHDPESIAKFLELKDGHLGKAKAKFSKQWTTSEGTFIVLYKPGAVSFETAEATWHRTLSEINTPHGLDADFRFATEGI